MPQRFLACLGPSGFHRLAYREWPGPPAAPTLLCVHRLTRNGRDFDAIAQVLSAPLYLNDLAPVRDFLLG